MARRVTKAEVTGMFWLVVLAIPVLIVIKIHESIGWGGWLIGLALVVIWYVWRQYSKNQEAEAHRKASEAAYASRRAELMEKYKDEKIVDDILARRCWVGQTSEQLTDSLGAPVDTDEKVMKTKRREVWKYHQTGHNRFALRVTLEDRIVVGWDEKL